MRRTVGAALGLVTVGTIYGFLNRPDDSGSRVTTVSVPATSAPVETGAPVMVPTTEAGQRVETGPTSEVSLQASRLAQAVLDAADANPSSTVPGDPEGLQNEFGYAPVNVHLTMPGRTGDIQIEATAVINTDTDSGIADAPYVRINSILDDGSGNPIITNVELERQWSETQQATVWNLATNTNGTERFFTNGDPSAAGGNLAYEPLTNEIISQYVEPMVGYVAPQG